MSTGGTRAHDEMDGASVGAAKRRIRVEWARNVAHGRGEATSPNTTLYVADYDPQTSVEDLRSMFEAFGKVIRVTLCKKFTFIEFEKMEDAQKAHDEMQDKMCGTRTLTVQYARPEPHRASTSSIPAEDPAKSSSATAPVSSEKPESKDVVDVATSATTTA